MSALLIPIPCSLPFPSTATPLLFFAPNQNRRLPLFRMDHSKVRHPRTKSLTVCPEPLPHCPRRHSAWGFSRGQTHVFTSWYLLSLRLITLPGHCPLTLWLCDTEYHLINQTLGKIQGEGLSAANCHPCRALISHQTLKVSLKSLIKVPVSPEWLKTRNHNKSKQHH